MAASMTGYLQHKAGPKGPYRTERVEVRHGYLDHYLVFFEGRWRRVYIQVDRLFIRYRGERITVQIEGNPV